MFILLSYSLGIKTPLFGMNPPNVFREIESIGKGDHCNSSLIIFFNHNGTHIDGPRHFDEKGREIGDYEIEEFIFERPRLIEIRKEEDEAIGIVDMVENESDIQTCDLLLIRTGFYKKRGEKSSVESNPWIDNSAAMFLRKQRNLKAIGIDAVSVSSFSHLDIGETHRILLVSDLHPSEPKLIIEDMKLSGNLEGLRRVFVIPLFMNGADSAPCTVFAEVERG